MNQRFDAVMFDLDGTLLDTLADIAAAGNHAMQQVGRPGYPLSDYRHLAGQGAPWLIEQALGPDHQNLRDAALAEFKKYQLVHGIDRTGPYPGIADMLNEMTRRKLPLAVLSNKPDRAAQHAVSVKLATWPFALVQGHQENVPLKPDPAAALEMAKKLNIAADRWLYLGDTRIDMLTAKRAGFFALGVSWGFRSVQELTDSGADAIIDHPMQAIDYL